MNPDTKPKILVFTGSIRKDSYNRKLAAAAAEALRNAGADVTLADLGDYPLPLYDGDLETAQGMPEGARAFKELASAHDGLVIASPEYNGSFSALLKNTIDWISRPEPGQKALAAFSGKVAAILSGSPGPGGGQRGLRHLRELLEMIGVTVIPAQLTVPRVTQAFDAASALARPDDQKALDGLAAGLVEAIRAKQTVAV